MRQGESMRRPAFVGAGILPAGEAASCRQSWKIEARRLVTGRQDARRYHQDVTYC